MLVYKYDEDYKSRNITVLKSVLSMLMSSLCDSADAQILVKGTISVAKTAVVGEAANNNNKHVIFKNCTPLTDCTSEANNTQVEFNRIRQ